jgi:hypothetical protein
MTFDLLGDILNSRMSQPFMALGHESQTAR